MTSSSARRHHYLPRFLLNRFADEAGHVAVRRRDGAYFVASTRDAAVETDLYTRVSATGVRDNSMEQLLAGIESDAAPLVADLGAGRIPKPRTDERSILAHFFAFQAARSPEHFERFGFVEDALAYAAGRDITLDLVGEYLSTEYLPGMRLAYRETEAITFFLQGLLNMPDGPPIVRDAYLEPMFTNAVAELAPRIETRAWCLLRCRKPRLVTSDRGATLRRERRPGDDPNSGVGIETAQEIWVPLDPKTLLAVRRDAFDSTEDVEPKVFDKATQVIASQASRAIFGDPTRPKVLKTPHMAATRPRLRFQMASMTDLNGVTTEIIHNWVPVDDRPVSSKQSRLVYTGPPLPVPREEDGGRRVPRDG